LQQVNKKFKKKIKSRIVDLDVTELKLNFILFQTIKN